MQNPVQVDAASLPTQSRRIFLAAGSACAVFGSLGAATTAPAVSPELERLIEAHRVAQAMFNAAECAYDEADTRFEAMLGEAGLKSDLTDPTLVERERRKIERTVKVNIFGQSPVGVVEAN